MFNDEDRQIGIFGGHGILTKEDLPDLTEASRRIFNLMKDGAWHTAEEIEAVSEQREGLRRMRDLRRRGHEIEVKRDGSTRRFLYRLTPRQKKLSASEMWRRS